MSTSLQLQRTVHKTLSQRLPDRRKTRRCALAQMITGLHLSQHVHLSRIADYIPGRAQLNSKTRRLRRFLDNDAVDPHRYYEPVRRLLVQAAAQSNERIRLLLDTLELSGHRQILMAALAYRRRALPLRWQVRRRTGVSSAEQQISLLRTLAEQMPDQADVIVVGDGAFHSTDLMNYITEQGWHFRLRLHTDACVRMSDGESEEWKSLQDYVPEKGARRYLQDVYLTKDEAFGPVSIAICYEEGEDDPWLICTDQQAGYLTLRTYSRRMWIEELFGDLEDGGFHLNRSRIYKTARLSRLVMALSWAYVWLIHVGAWVVKRGLRWKVDRTGRRDRSYVEIGRRWLRRCMLNGRPLRIGFKPYF